MFCSIALILTGVLGVFSPLPPQWTMVMVALSTFLVLKVHSLSVWISAGRNVALREMVLWFTAWPGFDIGAFLEQRLDAPPRSVEWVWPLANTIVGMSLWVVAAPVLLERSLLLAGWCAMTGIVLTFHFGTLHICTLLWRIAGRDVPPVMDTPVCSTSLTEFWGRRWNIAFRDFAHPHVFKPATARWNGTAALWLSFCFSGLIHELAISVPASGGYGLPMSFFVLQGIGVSLERSLSKQGWRVRGGWRGWCFAALFLIPGAPMLFHPAFVTNVVIPLIPVSS